MKQFKNKMMWIVILAILLLVAVISASTTYCAREGIVKKAEGILEDYKEIDIKLGTTVFELKCVTAERDFYEEKYDKILAELSNNNTEKTILENDRDLYKSGLISSVKFIVLLQDIMEANSVIYPEFIIDLPLGPEDLLKDSWEE